ncbi:MAG TPA: outer membrane protein assembly factor BamD, partial [Bdellovibrionota bacterium]|nr:outer membrane protein assembly factor BamD [Bdellovibrionota bacterium]
HMSKPLNFIVFLCITSLITACSTPSTTSSSSKSSLAAADYFNEGVKLKQSKRWEDAIDRFETVKFRFPLSNYTKQAELEIADIHFLQKAWVESRTAYEIFKKFHPRDKELPFVLYRVGLTYFYEMPSSVDRDLEPIEKTVEAFDEFLKTFPSSQYADDARTKRNKARSKLAERSLYVAEFYHKRKSYRAALGRALEVLEQYSDTEQLEEAYFYVISSYDKLGNKSKAQKHYNDMLQKFPRSKFAPQFKDLKLETSGS